LLSINVVRPVREHVTLIRIFEEFHCADKPMDLRVVLTDDDANEPDDLHPGGRGAQSRKGHAV
jgi:hypothetical protein